MSDEQHWDLKTPDFSRVEFNYVELEFDEVDDAEEKAQEYYAQSGYTVVKLRGLSETAQSELKDRFDFFNNVYFKEPGLPDFFAFRVFQELVFDKFSRVDEREVMHNYRFVEVKSENDGLRPNQIKWVSKHNHAPIDVAVVKENGR